MRKRLLILAALLLLAVVLVLVLRLVVRGFADWLANTLDHLLPYLQFVPKPILWGVLLAIVLLVMLDGIIGIRWRRRGEQDRSRARPGRVGTWQRAIRLANHGSAYQDAYRWRLAQDLANLIEEVLSRGEPLHAAPTRRLAESLAAEVPAEAQDCLTAAQGPVIFRRTSPLRRLFGRQSRRSPLDFDLEEIVAFLEQQMEV